MSNTKTNKIKIVDLFSGVGGLTFGFYYKCVKNKFVRNNVFKIIFANDFDISASEAFTKNYPNIKMLNTSIENIDIDYLKDNKIDISDVDVIIGGPPCQSYSTVGKRENDDRSKMYIEYRRLLDIIKPKMFIFENVLGILSFKTDEGKKIIDIISQEFDQLGYKVEKQILNAKNYGVPQNRLRVFLVGTRKDLNLSWNFPVALESQEISLRDAINDLPPVRQKEHVENYFTQPQTSYQELMKGTSSKLNDHYCGTYGHRITSIISNLEMGESHTDINRKVNEGLLSKDLFLSSGYHNSYGRLWWDKPSSTITNNFGTPSAIRCIHPEQNRALTIREAARIQSFPDNFIFIGNKAQKSSQIGNAVPPLLAIHLASEVEKTIRGVTDGE